MNAKKFVSITLLTLIEIFWLASAKNESSFVLKIAKEEMQRNMKELSKESLPPYFIGYEIIDAKETRIESSFGKTLQFTDNKTRTLDVDLRVGDYSFDNTHILRDQGFSFLIGGAASNAIPLENDPLALKSAIWKATDMSYKAAASKYEKLIANKAVKVKEDDTTADFSKERPYKYLEIGKEAKIDKEAWKSKLNEATKIFADYDWIYDCDAFFVYKTETKYIVNSEGTEIQTFGTYSRIFISARTKTEDGMSLPLYKSFFAFDPKNLPSLERLKSAAKDLIAKLDKLRKAKTLETTYSGPAILSGEAAGVFFHEIFGHRIEGQRFKNPDDAQTFKGSVGKKVLSDNLDVVSDPSLKFLRGVPLSGYYKFDDQGVKARRVQIVKNGTLKNFLMSRKPIEGFPHSNGHGRKAPGYPAFSRQSNLIVQAKKTVPFEELKNKLRKLCKEKNLEFGLLFDVVQGGFTFTGRTLPNSFNVSPLLVYKVYADGRPDEVVRGVNLIGTPLATFSNIIAAADDIGVFNGICGAESGGVPVSACSPSLLVSKIEVQQKPKSQDRLPILPPPNKKRASD